MPLTTQEKQKVSAGRTPVGSVSVGRTKSGHGKAAKPPVNQAGRPTAVELERRKAKVMEVATDLFVHHGYAATSLVDIAKGAGVATRTLYQHFGDKEAMFRDVIFARDTGVAIVPPRIEVGDTLFSMLERTARYMHDFSLQPRSIDLMRLMIAESKRFPELIRGVANATFARFRRNLANIFAGLADADLIPRGDYDRWAELYVDLVLGTMPIMTYAEWLGSPHTDADVAERIDLFILGAFGPKIAQQSRTQKVELAQATAAE